MHKDKLARSAQTSLFVLCIALVCMPACARGPASHTARKHPAPQGLDVYKNTHKHGAELEAERASHMRAVQTAEKRYFQARTDLNLLPEEVVSPARLTSCLVDEGCVTRARLVQFLEGRWVPGYEVSSHKSFVVRGAEFPQGGGELSDDQVHLKWEMYILTRPANAVPKSVRRLLCPEGACVWPGSGQPRANFMPTYSQVKGAKNHPSIRNKAFVDGYQERDVEPVKQTDDLQLHPVLQQSPQGVLSRAISTIGGAVAGTVGDWASRAYGTPARGPAADAEHPPQAQAQRQGWELSVQQPWEDQLQHPNSGMENLQEWRAQWEPAVLDSTTGIAEPLAATGGPPGQQPPGGEGGESAPELPELPEGGRGGPAWPVGPGPRSSIIPVDSMLPDREHLRTDQDRHIQAALIFGSIAMAASIPVYCVYTLTQLYSSARGQAVLDRKMQAHREDFSYIHNKTPPEYW